MEGEALMAAEPGTHLGVFVSGVVVEDDVDGLADRHLGVDAVEKADEFLMAMPLHVLADNGAVEHVESSKQCGRAMALVIMGHRAAAALLQRKSWLRPIERLDLAHMGICGSRGSDQDSMVNLRSLLGIQGLSRLHDPARFRCRFKLTSGRR